MNKDTTLLSEAYQTILEKKTMCKYAKEGCDCDCGCKDCKKNQKNTVEEAKKLSPAQKKIAAAAPPPDEITGDDFKALKARKSDKNKLKEAYEQILEASATDKVINKKLARDYYKAVKAMRKCEHGSKEYDKFKSQKEDIVKLVNDHGKTIADLDSFLTKKEKEEVTEEHVPCEAAARGCDCAGCEECKANQYNNPSEEV